MTVPTPDVARKLHWTQRIALVRHNLHAARRTGDYTFFKALQAHALIDGTDHVATLNAALGSDAADGALATLDNLNAGIAYVHQDAFKAVYDAAKATMYKVGNSLESRKSLLKVDAGQQREMADHAIDKTANAAITLIEQQIPAAQEAVANAWVVGATIIADAVEVCLKGIQGVEEWRDDFIAMEYAWGSVQSAVDGAVAALRGVFSLMEQSGSVSSMFPYNPDNSCPYTPPSQRTSRSSSNASTAFGLIKRAFSTSHGMGGPAPPQKTWQNGSVSSVTHPFNLRQSISAACPTRIPNGLQASPQALPQAPPPAPPPAAHQHFIQRLSTIPPTPSSEDLRMSPFFSAASAGKNGPGGDYFKFASRGSPGEDDESEASWRDGGKREDMQIESLDPLYSPEQDPYQPPAPLTIRRLSALFQAGGSAGSPITV